MKNFYTSEILVLTKKIDSLDQEEKFLLAEKIMLDYLSKKEAFSNHKNLVYFNQEFNNFPIEEIRRMQTEAEYSSSFNGQENRVFVLFNFDSAGDAAQNAALKIIEEGPTNTLILLLISKEEKILKTILSRCISVQLEGEALPEKIEAFFWPKNYSQAIELAEQNKDRCQALNLIESLLRKKLEINEANKAKQILFRAYQDLNRNQNVQLTLENCFFSLVSLEG